MPKKCVPGVICIENATLLFITILCVIAGYIAYTSYPMSAGRMQQQQQQQQQRVQVQVQPQMQQQYSLDGRDVLLDPHMPPTNMGYVNTAVATGRTPVNVPTNGRRATSYTQVGILTPSHNKSSSGPNPTILALMGRETHAGRQKWQYYTISDQNNSVKLPVSRNGRSCTSENGCDELGNGDTVFVEGYNQAFGVTMYDTDNTSYIPYL